MNSETQKALIPIVSQSDFGISKYLPPKLLKISIIKHFAIHKVNAG